MANVEGIKNEYDNLLQQLGDPELISDWPASTRQHLRSCGGSDAGWAKFEELSKRKIFLEKIIEKDKEIQEIKNKIEENKSILSAKEDSELISLAQEELISLNERKKSLEKELENLLKSEGKNKGSQSVVVEIRAGTGGDEAALFAADLFRMYSRYGQLQDWKQQILDSRPSGIGGFKEIIFELKSANGGGGDVFSKMKFEGGVHRVQRIPETEKQGRVHTSTATVAVLPKPKRTEIKINPQDLRIDFYRASGKGGQNVNKRETAVRITHKLSGIVVTSQTERNQLQNRENAMAILEVRLLEKKEMEEEGKISGKRKTQIKWAKRAEKIRTYNFPQDRVTDHRVKKSWHNIEGVMNGKLELVVEALRKVDEAKASSSPFASLG